MNGPITLISPLDVLLTVAAQHFQTLLQANTHTHTGHTEVTQRSHRGHNAEQCN